VLTIGDISRRGARIFADKEAVVFEGHRFTYGAFDERVNRLANALLDLGCVRGDRVAVYSENTHRFLEAYFAVAKAGLVVVPLNFRLSDHEIVQILNNAEPVLLFVGEGFETKARILLEDVPGIRRVVAMDAPMDGGGLYEDLLARASGEDPNIALDENDLVAIVYTGGTTGVPKGVMLSHRNILVSATSITLSCQFSHRDATCMLLPLFHVAFWPAFCLMMVGGKVALLRRPDLEAVLWSVQNERCTHINAVPTLYTWLLDFPSLDRFDLSSLRLMTYSGSPMPSEVLRRCITKFGNIFAQGYGMTEAAPSVTFLFPEDHCLEGEKSKLLASVGKEGLGVEVRVVDAEGKSVGRDEVGEVTVRGANIMLGYWRNKELTEEKLRGGWLHTGDLGALDKDGYLYLRDRKADMIITGGENVYPTETEDVIYQHPAVYECAVVAVPDERWGERVQAAVVLKPGAAATQSEIIDFCKQHLAHYKCPKNVVFWESIPKSPVGKILRKDVRKGLIASMEGHSDMRMADHCSA
jgi:acyl-CoA synthetase (AMP-forming)/AMP-acid ligase II